MRCFVCGANTKEPYQQFCTQCEGPISLQPIRLEVRLPNGLTRGGKCLLQWRLLANPQAPWPANVERVVDFDFQGPFTQEHGAHAVSIPAIGYTNTGDLTFIANDSGIVSFKCTLTINNRWVARGTGEVSVSHDASSITMNLGGHKPKGESVAVGNQTFNVNQIDRQAQLSEFRNVPLELVTEVPPKHSVKKLSLLNTTAPSSNRWLLLACPGECRENGNSLFQIGRSKSQDFQILCHDRELENRVSRRHARLQLGPDGAQWIELPAGDPAHTKWVTEINGIQASENEPWSVPAGARIEIPTVASFEAHHVRETIDQFDRLRYRRLAHQLNRRYCPSVGPISAIGLSSKDETLRSPQRVIFLQQAASLGANPTSLIHVEGTGVEYIHARILYLADQFWIEALSPLTHNGRPLPLKHPERLSTGDTLSVGIARLTVINVE